MKFSISKLTVNFRAVITAATVFAFAFGAASVTVAQGTGGKNSRLVEPVDFSKLEKPDYEKLSKTIENLSVQAVVYGNVNEPLEEAYDGSPRQAKRIIAIKLQVLKKLSESIPLSIGAIEDFNATTELILSKWDGKYREIDSQVIGLEDELSRLGDLLESQGASRDPGVMMLVSNKLERKETLNGDLEKLNELKRSVNRSQENIKRLKRVIQTFSELTKEEAKRQRDSLRRSRFAKQSNDIHRQAESLAKTVRALETGTAELGKLSKNSSGPVITSNAPPETHVPETPLTAEAKQRVEEFLKSRRK